MRNSLKGRRITIFYLFFTFYTSTRSSMSLLTSHFRRVTVVLSWLLMPNISLLTCHSCTVTLHQTLSKYHSWQTNLYQSLLISHFWPSIIEISLLNCIPLTCIFRPVTLDLSLLKYHSRHGTLYLLLWPVTLDISDI